MGLPAVALVTENDVDKVLTKRDNPLSWSKI